MAILEVNKIVHQRNEKGELIPLEVPLETLEKENGEYQTVLILPLMRGEIKKIFSKTNINKDTKNLETSKDQDGELIKNCLVEPKLSEIEISFLKPKYSNAIATAILSISLGKTQKELNDAGKEALKKYAEKIESDLKKK